MGQKIDISEAEISYSEGDHWHFFMAFCQEGRRYTAKPVIALDDFAAMTLAKELCGDQGRVLMIIPIATALGVLQSCKTSVGS